MEKNWMKKTTALLCAVALLCVGLAGCTLPEEPTRPTQGEVTQPSTEEVTEPSTEEVTEPSQEEVTEPSQEEWTVEVVDLEDPSIASGRYHLPYVVGFEAVNQKIQAELLPMADEEGWDDIGYSVGYKGDAVTILAKCEGFSDDCAYFTYYFDRITGQLLAQEDILSLYALTKQEFEVLAEAQVLDCFETRNEQWAQQLPEMYAQLQQETVSGTLANGRVFVDVNGNLGFVAYIGTPAGSGHEDLVLSCWEGVQIVDVTFPGTAG